MRVAMVCVMVYLIIYSFLGGGGGLKYKEF